MKNDDTLHEFTIDTPVMQALFNSGSKWPKGFRAASKEFRAIANSGVRKLRLGRVYDDDDELGRDYDYDDEQLTIVPSRFPNLQELTMEDTCVTDAGALAGLSKLTRLTPNAKQNGTPKVNRMSA